MTRLLPASATALVACVIIFTLLPCQARAQQSPASLVASEAILLRATTPLGEAGVEIAAGTILTHFEIQGDRVRVWQGPFTATVALADVLPPEPTPSPTPEPTATPAPTPEPSPDTTPALPQEAPATWGLDSISWPPWVFPAAVGALALYAVLSTLALIRLRQPPKHAAPPPVSIKSPEPSAAKSAVISGGGHAMGCPHCGTNIPITQLSPGRHTCPSCKGSFACE